MPIHFGDFFKNTCDSLNDNFIGKLFSSPIISAIIITIIIIIICYFFVYNQGKFKKSKQIPCMSKFGFWTLCSVIIILMIHNRNMIKYKNNVIHNHNMTNIIPDNPEFLYKTGGYHQIEPKLSYQEEIPNTPAESSTSFGIDL